MNSPGSKTRINVFIVLSSLEKNMIQKMNPNYDRGCGKGLPLPKPPGFGYLGSPGFTPIYQFLKWLLVPGSNVGFYLN
jgi:hypothetical protein